MYTYQCNIGLASCTNVLPFLNKNKVIAPKMAQLGCGRARCGDGKLIRMWCWYGRVCSQYSFISVSIFVILMYLLCVFSVLGFS